MNLIDKRTHNHKGHSEYVKAQTQRLSWYLEFPLNSHKDIITPGWLQFRVSLKDDVWYSEFSKTIVFISVQTYLIWYTTLSSHHVLCIFSYEIRIHGGESSGNGKQPRNQHPLPEPGRHKEHKHHAHDARDPKRIGSKEVRLLPHLLALQRPHHANPHHVVGLHELEHRAQREFQQTSDEDEGHGADVAPNGPHDDQNLQGNGQEAGERDHDRQGRSGSRGLRGQAGVELGEEGKEQGEAEGHERDDEDGQQARDGETRPHVHLVGEPGEGC